MFLIMLLNWPYCSSTCNGHFVRYFVGSYALDIFMKALKRGVRLLRKQGDSEEVFRILSRRDRFRVFQLSTSKINHGPQIERVWMAHRRMP